jgi:hypothetical protein
MWFSFLFVSPPLLLVAAAYNQDEGAYNEDHGYFGELANI